MDVFRTLILFLVISPVYGDIEIPFASYHFSSEQDWNQFNPGLIYTDDSSAIRYKIGGYYNSYYKPSYILMAGKTLYQSNNTSIAFNFGFATGYPIAKFVIGGSLELTYKKLRIYFVPPAPNVHSTIGLSFLVK